MAIPDSLQGLEKVIGKFLRSEEFILFMTFIFIAPDLHHIIESVGSPFHNDAIPGNDLFLKVDLDDFFFNFSQMLILLKHFKGLSFVENIRIGVFDLSELGLFVEEGALGYDFIQFIVLHSEHNGFSSFR